MELTVRPPRGGAGADEAGRTEDREEISVLVLGREGSGRTSLVLSLEAVRAGAYPRRTERKQEDPVDVLGSRGGHRGGGGYHQSAALRQLGAAITSGGGATASVGAEEKITPRTFRAAAEPLPDGGLRHTVPPRIAGGLPLVLTDTQPCGARDQVRLPGGRRLPIALRSSSLKHDAVLFVLDATQRPLWEDPDRTEELGSLSATLRQQGYGVVIAVTKLLKAREDALREVRHHGPDLHGGRPGRDPRASYEEFVSRYLEKTIVTLQANPQLKAWQAAQDPGTAKFPKAGTTVFDVPTWVSIRDWEVWQSRRGTAEQPNLRYIEAQLNRLAAALEVRPKVPSGSPWYQLVDDERSAGGA